eukprot:g41629.t1
MIGPEWTGSKYFQILRDMQHWMKRKKEADGRYQGLKRVETPEEYRMCMRELKSEISDNMGIDIRENVRDTIKEISTGRDDVLNGLAAFKVGKPPRLDEMYHKCM